MEGRGRARERREGWGGNCKGGANEGKVGGGAREERRERRVGEEGRREEDGKGGGMGEENGRRSGERNR